MRLLLVVGMHDYATLPVSAVLGQFPCPKPNVRAFLVLGSRRILPCIFEMNSLIHC